MIQRSEEKSAKICIAEWCYHDVVKVHAFQKKMTIMQMVLPVPWCISVCRQGAVDIAITIKYKSWHTVLLMAALHTF